MSNLPLQENEKSILYQSVMCNTHLFQNTNSGIYIAYMYNIEIIRLSNSGSLGRDPKKVDGRHYNASVFFESINDYSSPCRKCLGNLRGLAHSEIIIVKRWVNLDLECIF